jgi:hypothetical protein
MYPRCAPQKILSRHSYNELAKLSGNSGPSTAPATPGAISPQLGPGTTAPAQDRRRLNDHQAVPPTRPPPHKQEPKQSIPKTKARTTRAAALEHSNLMAQGDRFQHQRGTGSGFAAGKRQRCVGRRRHEGRLSPDVRDRHNSCGLSFEKGQPIPGPSPARGSKMMNGRLRSSAYPRAARCGQDHN